MDTTPSAPRLDGLGDSLDTASGVGLNLVLPDADDAPSHAAQFLEVLLVPAAILGDFVSPEAGHFASPRRKAIAVPEIPIHKDSHLR